MDVYQIWVRYGYNGVVALVDAWDDDTIQENPEGYQEAIATAEKDCEPETGGQVRVVRTRVDLDAVRAAFDVPDVASEIVGVER